MRVLVWLLFALPSALSAAVSSQNSSLVCNNSPDLCSKSYGDITHLGTHDSAFVRNASNGYTVSGNQNLDTTAQLDAGVRLLSAQVHSSNGEWHLCHSSCLLFDVGPLHQWLSEIKTWMDNNPHDVVTIILVNSDDAAASDLHAEFQTASITSYAYTPPSAASPPQVWPTLENLIANNTRLITFVASLSSSTNTVAPYLLDEFTFVSENPFEVTDFSGFSCDPDRPSSVKGAPKTAVKQGLLPMINHFKDIEQAFSITIPDVGNIITTNGQSNSVGSLGTTASLCKSAYGKAPTFILVDFFDKGSAIDTVDSLNSITAVGRIAPPPQQATSASLGRSDLLSEFSIKSNSFVGLLMAVAVSFALL